MSVVVLGVEGWAGAGSAHPVAIPGSTAAAAVGRFALTPRQSRHESGQQGFSAPDIGWNRSTDAAGPPDGVGESVLRCGVAFARWDPLRDLLALHERIGHLTGTDNAGWTPPVDLYENSMSFVLTAELPGLTREDFEVHAEESRITIRGGRASATIPCEQYHRVERAHGPFSRTFVLPEPIDVEAVTADFKDGLLTLTIPKAGGRGVRRIAVD
jgi:HSP20 family protein